MNSPIRFTLNGKPVEVDTDGDRKLLWVLRADLALTGTKYGCGKAYCGSCVVLLNGKAARSCTIALKNIEGAKITTIEGLEQNGTPHPLQKAFMDHDALQCGFCTPGMILSAYSLLQRKPNPSDQDIINAMDQSLCRCGAHQRIVRAIKAAAKDMRKELPVA
ncbi:MAG: (2Fe-2S)-binding protein [Candidatus Omnitrophica bacterium]|nr:(2Fe-2S)-binding protein [Candidatus Omnitrophota bacterium]